MAKIGRGVSRRATSWKQRSVDTHHQSTPSQVLLSSFEVVEPVEETQWKNIDLYASTETLSEIYPDVVLDNDVSDNKSKAFFLTRLGSTLLRKARGKKDLIDKNNDDGMEITMYSEEGSVQDRVSSATSIESLAKPIVPQDVWDSLTGREFQEHPEVVDQLVKMGENMARNDDSNEWIAWNVYGKHDSDLMDGSIHLWTGKAKQTGYGSKLPWIKTRFLLALPPQEVVELLMDSERVKTYNQWSLGRQDVWVGEGGQQDDNAGQTKIVKNRTQPPVGSKPMVSVTFMHSRPLPQEEGAWIVISRAVGGSLYQDEQDKGAGRSDILLGVNMLQPVSGDPNSSLVTTITHVYSTAVPNMLAEQLGVKGGIKFAKDLRQVKRVTVSQ